MDRAPAGGRERVAKRVQAFEQSVEPGMRQGAVGRLEGAVEPLARPVDLGGDRRDRDAQEAEAWTQLGYGKRLGGGEVARREPPQAAIDEFAPGQAKAREGVGVKAVPHPARESGGAGRGGAGRGRKAPTARPAPLPAGGGEKVPNVPR